MNFYCFKTLKLVEDRIKEAYLVSYCADNEIPLSFIVAYFPRACCLENRCTATNALKILKLTDDVIHIPTMVKGWKNEVYCN